MGAGGAGGAGGEAGAGGATGGGGGCGKLMVRRHNDSLEIGDILEEGAEEEARRRRLAPLLWR